MLKQSLQQKLGLKINPLQIQLIKLLEMPTFQLEQRIKEEIEQNPLLEDVADSDEKDDDKESLADDSGMENDNNSSDNNDDDEFSMEDYISDDDDTPDYKLSTSNASKDDEERELVLSQTSSFRDSLTSQLGLRELSEEDRQLSDFIIGNIDDDGYLRRDTESIVDDIAFSVGKQVDIKKIEDLLHIIQELDPPGVGARDLRECLLLQLKRKMADNTTPALSIAKQIIEDHFEEFSKKHFEKINHYLKINDDQLRDAMDEILKLNPKPGNSSADVVHNSEKVIPDFNLDLVDGELQLTLNTGNLPELRINKSYMSMLDSYQKGEETKEKKDVVSFMKYKLSSAKSFIDAIQQRNNTLMLCMTAIIQFQKDFFMTGDGSLLKPMILKDISDVTNLDVSTISRVSNSKYIQTWFGIFALKDFFSGSMQTITGDDISTNELKSELQRLVDEEDKASPLTDDEIVTMMNKKGYQIARRTVAKYRQMLDIPVARLRREI